MVVIIKVVLFVATRSVSAAETVATFVNGPVSGAVATIWAETVARAKIEPSENVTVPPEFVAVPCHGETLREHDLNAVAGPDVFLGPQHLGLKRLPGHVGRKFQVRSRHRQ